MTDDREFIAALRAALGDAYDVERELTGGGMSRVFLGTERALGRPVVVKVLPPDLAAGVNRDRFRREIHVAAQLQHPHIVPLYAAGAAGELLYFTMPYIAGESLRHALHEGYRFSVREVVGILHDVADALAYAHARGVIHRDIKPGNVLRSGAHAVVTDFGVAKAITAARAGVTTTSSGTAIGTPAYMAPEQLAGDPAADHRVDIYALGLLGYELLSGKSPFAASSPRETLAAQLTLPPKPIKPGRSDVPADLEAIIAKCLEKDPGGRPMSALDVVAVLDRLDLSAKAASGARAAQNRVLRIALSAAAVTVLGIATAIALRPRETAVDAVGAAVVSVDDAPVTQVVGRLLTREDSLAIAAAVQRKMSEQDSRPRTTMPSSSSVSVTSPPTEASAGAPERIARSTDSMRLYVEKAVLDSVSKLRGLRPGIIDRFYAAMDSQRVTVRSPDRVTSSQSSVLVMPQVGAMAPPSQPRAEEFEARRKSMGSPRRVFVSGPLSPEANLFRGPAVDSLVDSLRRTIGREARFIPVPADSVRIALENAHTLSGIASDYSADVFVTVVGHALTSTTGVLWRITVRDLTAHQNYALRMTVELAPPAALLGRADSLVAHTLRFLADLDRAPRRSAEPHDGLGGNEGAARFEEKPS